MNADMVGLEETGFCQISGFLSKGGILSLSGALAEVGCVPGRAGIRGLAVRCPAIKSLALSESLLSIVNSALGRKARLVRSVLFTKSDAANWTVGWHQDLSIAVDRRSELAGFSNWSSKGGVVHVQPPISVLERMIVLRLHLDEATRETGALAVVPGSHKLGRVGASRASIIAYENVQHFCTATPGDLLILRPLLLHSSKKASPGSLRRVVHLEYSDAELPRPLEWNAAA